jgi:hypothetical protein
VIRGIGPSLALPQKRHFVSLCPSSSSPHTYALARRAGLSQHLLLVRGPDQPQVPVQRVSPRPHTTFHARARMCRVVSCVFLAFVDFCLACVFVRTCLCACVRSRVCSCMRSCSRACLACASDCAAACLGARCHLNVRLSLPRPATYDPDDSLSMSHLNVLEPLLPRSVSVLLAHSVLKSPTRAPHRSFFLLLKRDAVFTLPH